MTTSKQTVIRQSARISGLGQMGVIQVLFRAKKWICDPYRPELHYMRGPGPKWHEKNTRNGSI